MQNKDINLKIVKNKSGSRSRGPRKPTNRDLILQLSKKLDNFIDYVQYEFKKHGWTK